MNHKVKCRPLLSAARGGQKLEYCHLSNRFLEHCHLNLKCQFLHSIGQYFENVDFQSPIHSKKTKIRFGQVTIFQESIGTNAASPSQDITVLNHPWLIILGSQDITQQY